MNRYLTLINFTETGAKALKKSPARASAFAKAARRAGVKIEAQYWCLGQYDGVLITSGKGDKPLKVLAKLAALGNVRTQTLKLQDAVEFAALFKG